MQGANMVLQDKKALITGALGTLGYSQAKLLAEHGAEVWLLDRPETDNQDIIRTVSSKGPANAHFVGQDLADLSGTAKRLRVLSEKIGGFDILINNAAQIINKPFEDFSIEEYESMIRINSSAAFVITQALADPMKTKAYGKIVNLCSLTLNGRLNGYVPYVASKGAIFGLTKGIARELGPFGICVNAVSPGAIVSDAEARVFGEKAQEYSDWVIENQSLKHRGDPEDVAQLVLFLVSPVSDFISGQNYGIDGGW